jgi:CheY-like chemotaxis protein
VDDNTVNRQILDRRVADWLMEPTSVDGGRKALEVLTAAAREGRPFRLMLLDAKMPEIDGFAVAAEVAQRPELADTSIVMLSSSSLGSEISRSREVGIAVYLTKPVRPNELLSAIGRAIDPDAKRMLSSPLMASPSRGSSSVRRRRILVAEDNVVNQRVAVSLLTKRGHDVTMVDNGLKVVELLARDSFDLVLMDVQMPQMDGFEATQAIRTREKMVGGHTRIVAMTAHALNGDSDRCLEAGMDGYLSKPLNPRKLYAAVEEEPATGPTSDESIPAPATP